MESRIFFLWRGSLGDIVMHVLRKLYKERCPEAHSSCAVLPFCIGDLLIRRLCWQNAESTEPASFRNLVLDAIPGDFCVGGNWHVQAYAETESVMIGPPRWS